MYSVRRPFVNLQVGVDMAGVVFFPSAIMSPVYHACPRKSVTAAAHRRHLYRGAVVTQPYGNYAPDPTGVLYWLCIWRRIGITMYRDANPRIYGLYSGTHLICLTLQLRS